MRIMHDSVKAYLNEISRYPLLTPAQEIELSRQVDAMQAMRDVQDPHLPRSASSSEEEGQNGI